MLFPASVCISVCISRTWVNEMWVKQSVSDTPLKMSNTGGEWASARDQASWNLEGLESRAWQTSVHWAPEINCGIERKKFQRSFFFFFFFFKDEAGLPHGLWGADGASATPDSHRVPHSTRPGRRCHCTFPPAWGVHGKARTYYS